MFPIDSMVGYLAQTVKACYIKDHEELVEQVLRSHFRKGSVNETESLEISYFRLGQARHHLLYSLSELVMEVVAKR